MGLGSFFNQMTSQITGASQLEGRVSSLRGRENNLVLPRCEHCGFGTMRVRQPTNDKFEEKLAPGHTRLRCDRGDCGREVVVNTRDTMQLA